MVLRGLMDQGLETLVRRQWTTGVELEFVTRAYEAIPPGLCAKYRALTY